MKYFIDFEATQYSNEIISVGCIKEDGQSFYSLVAPVEGKITPFITNLTGITAEMVKNAMSPDVVFDNMYHWVFDNDNDPEFYVWGNTDVDFVRHTFKRTNLLTARLILGYMSGSIRDYAKVFCKKYKLSSCSLIKAFKCIEPNAEQNHNALDDAMMLYKIVNNIDNISDEVIKEQFVCFVPKEENDEDVIGHLPTGTIYVIAGKKFVKAFEEVEDAAEWFLDKQGCCKNMDKETKDASTITVIKNIKKHIANGKCYGNFKWRVK